MSWILLILECLKQGPSQEFETECQNISIVKLTLVCNIFCFSMALHPASTNPYIATGQLAGAGSANAVSMVAHWDILVHTTHNWQYNNG